MFLGSFPQITKGMLHSVLYTSLNGATFMVIVICYPCLPHKFLDGKGHFLISIFSTTHIVVQ